MKGSKKILGAILTVAVTLSMLINVSIVAEASSYTVKISTGDVADASFDTSALTITGTGKLEGVTSREVTPGVNADYVLTISGLSYGDKISFDAAKLIKVPPTGKYNKVGGLKISGADELINPPGNTNITITVTESETYVASYIVDSIKEYDVEYSCKVTGTNSGKVNFDEKEALYAKVGELLVVPSRHYEGYIPTGVTVKVDGTEIKKDTDYTVGIRKLALKDENKKDYTKDVITEATIKALAEKTVVQFTYEPLGPTTSYETVTREDTYTIYGPPTYTYEYQYIDGQPVIRSTTNPGTTTVTNRRETNNNAAATTNENGGEAGGNPEGTGEGAGEADNTTTIGESETPLSGENGKENVEIPEPEPPKKGMSLVLKVIITVTVFTLFMIIMVLITSLVIRRRNYK